MNKPYSPLTDIVNDEVRAEGYAAGLKAAAKRASVVEKVTYKLAGVARAFLATGFGNLEDRFAAKEALDALDALVKE